VDENGDLHTQCLNVPANQFDPSRKSAETEFVFWFGNTIADLTGADQGDAMRALRRLNVAKSYLSGDSLDSIEIDLNDIRLSVTLPTLSTSSTTPLTAKYRGSAL
jgi:hypothetical protein